MSRPDRFKRFLDVVFHHEGGFSNHDSDPGGATKYGVTKKTLRRARGRRVSKQDVRNLTRDEAAQIYRDLYWDKVRGGQLPPAIALIVFDSAVNQGVGRAVRFLQKAAGVKVDGIIGPVTLQTTAESYSINAQRLIDELCARRMNHYGLLSIFRTFGLGWSRRLMNIHSQATRIAQ